MRNATDTPTAAAHRSALKFQLLWAGVTAASLLAAYVYTVNHAIERGESWRQAQRGVATQMAARLHHGAHVGDEQYAYISVP